MMHTVRFFTRRTPADAMARCSCGWSTTGSLHECQAAAAVHDLDELETTELQEHHHEPA